MGLTTMLIRGPPCIAIYNLIFSEFFINIYAVNNALIIATRRIMNYRYCYCIDPSRINVRICCIYKISIFDTIQIRTRKVLDYNWNFARLTINLNFISTYLKALIDIGNKIENWSKILSIYFFTFSWK